MELDDAVHTAILTLKEGYITLKFPPLFIFEFGVFYKVWYIKSRRKIQ
jgi:hypothetical protein